MVFGKISGKIQSSISSSGLSPSLNMVSLLLVSVTAEWICFGKNNSQNTFVVVVFLQKQLCAKYNTFQHQLEAAGKRVVTCQQLAESLLNSGHSESREIRQKQKELR